MKARSYILVIILFISVVLDPTDVFAHRSGCHRWHSCPSDSGSYTCGDAGHPCQYPTYPASGGVVYPPSGYYKDCYDCPLKKVPSNANTSGIGWTCDGGYKKVGETCEKTLAPTSNVPSTATSITYALAKGMQNNQVTKLQQILARYPEIYPEGLITSYFGPATERAVQKFQKKHGLEQVGYVGPKTRTLLNSL